MCKITTLLFFIFISGCATSISPSKLKPANDTSVYVLPKTTTITAIKGLASVKWLEGLAAGEYRAEYEDSEGVYYRGPKDCVILLMGDLADTFIKSGKLPSHEEKISKQPFYQGEDGGIWIPRNGINKQPKLYFYFQPASIASNSEQGGVLVSAIIESDRNKINFGPDVSDINILKVFATNKN